MDTAADIERIAARLIRARKWAEDLYERHSRDGSDADALRDAERELEIARRLYAETKKPAGG